MKTLSKTLLAAAATASVLPLILAAPANATERKEPARYSVTIENLTTGQWLTPPNWAAHGSQVHVFRRGAKASVGVQGVAENGAVPVLATELQAAIDGSGAGKSGVGGSAPIPPGGHVTFEFTSDARRFSVVSMIVCTNDGFTGLDSDELPERVGRTTTYRLRSFDAGTEINTEKRADIVPAPFCGSGQGSGQSNPALAEGGKIRPHKGIRGVGDMPASFDWDDPAALVRVTRL